MSRFFNWKVIVAAIIVAAIIFFSSIIGFLVDIQWFKEVGYLEVYFTELLTELKMGIPVFAVLTLLVYIYLIHMKNEYAKHSMVVYTKEQLKSVNLKLFMASVVISILMSMALTAAYWQDVLKFIDSSQFNLKDPLFNKDISFFIFRLPVYKALYSFVFGSLVILTIATLVFYLFVALKNGFDDSGNMDYNVLSMDSGKQTILGKKVFEYASRKLSFLISLIFIMIGAGYILKNYNLVYSPRGVAYGASYVDVNVSLLFNRALLGLSVIGALSVFYGIYNKKIKFTLWIIGIMIGASFVQGAVETGIQRLVVTPNEIDKERPYIQNNIKYTNIAYNLDKVEQKDFPADQNLTAKDIENNEATINNIRINDFGPTLEVYNQLQGIRSYYRFNDVDIDRYTIDGKYTQVFLAARELDQSKLNQQSQTWQNKHLVYTHGYGITMSPVNSITAQGQPNLILKDIPPVSSSNIKVDRPGIYFGELTNDYIIINTRLQEMDYPSGDSNIQTTYSGAAGIKLNPLNRLLFMVNEGSLNFLLSQDIDSNSRIIINRNIMERVQKIAPFLVYDKDPYLVVNGGKLYWIIDAYTTSSLFPYSEPTGNVNYVRNSVKVIVDAYNGDTNFYLTDENDPLAVTYSKIFPSLFKKISDIPEGFIDHFRYPEDIFNVQVQVYKKYHMADPRVFYNKEDLWAVAGDRQIGGQSKETQPMEPSYVIMKLPDGSNEEFMQISPYTPAGKDNMIAWIGARMDKQEYGKLIVYKFPKQKVTYGPEQFKARVSQNPDISKELSLWNQNGSSVINGTVITLPIEKSLMYIMPLYIKSSGQNSIPEVKRVILGYGDKIVMDDSLDKALKTLFDLNQLQNSNADNTTTTSVTPPPSGQTDKESLIKKANDEFNQAKDAQKNGDWSGYGKHIEELENILNQLNSMIKQ